MKKKLGLIIIVLFVVMSNISFGQNKITYIDVKNSEKRIKGKFDTYVSKDGTIYNIGDTINVGSPSGTNGKFISLTKVDATLNVYPVGAEAINTHIILKKIRVGGTKRSGFKVSFQTKGFTFVDNYFLNIEDAIKCGEIMSDGITSDEALKILKKEKDKLDLGLITQEEFNNKKVELSKYIK